MSTLLDLLARLPDTGSAAPVAPGALRFFAQGELPLDALAVDVDGVGPLSQPVSARQAQALQALSTPAHFGRREQTLLDDRVRHTGEISADGVGLQWQAGAFNALQQAVADALGVPALEASLHNLLVYGPGQFFKPHQDTERHPGMVATLVLVWPAAHLGGDLRVVLGAKEAVLASQHAQARSLRWFAFYADCRHEVLPVTEGRRLVLTFDLRVPDVGARPPLPEAWLAQLRAALRTELDLDAPKPAPQPSVLLLDHEYTEHGLRWPLLKGDDRWRVAALRAAGQALGLRLDLALAELHETWSAQPVFHTRVSRYGREYEEITDEAEPGECIDAEMVLDFWVDDAGQVGRGRALSVSPDRALSFVDTGDEHLTAQEYEGYMGNYGETLDYWYRRAALVIRSPAAVARDGFRQDFDGALAHARQLARDPAQAAALGRLLRSASSELEWQIRQRGRELLAPCIDLAVGLADGDAAVALLLDFDPSSFEPQDAADLARLLGEAGGSCLVRLLKAWYAPDDRRRSWSGTWFLVASGLIAPRPWPADLPGFLAAAQAASWSVDVLDAFLRGSLGVMQRFHAVMHRATPAQALALRPSLTAGAIAWAQAWVPVATASAGAAAARIRAGLHDGMDEILRCPALYPPCELAPVVRALGAVALQWPQPQSFASQVRSALRAELDQAPRPAADHGLRRVAWVCRCRDCLPVIDWAASPRAEPLEMAMAEQRRIHVQQTCEAAAAGLSFETIKRGSPYTLRLSKPGDLHRQEQIRRTRLARAWAALG